jgi:uncharacterized UPF0160 family protein
MTRIVTHNAKFHADDVFAVAVLLLVYPGATVVRSRDKNEIDQAEIVVDVGFVYDPQKGRFDHHQVGGAGEHTNGIPYAAFGLVWKEFGESLSGGQEVAEIIEQKLVMPIDAIDNGVVISVPSFPDVEEYRAGDLINSFVDYDKEDKKIDETFAVLVELAQRVIMNEIRSATLCVKARADVETAYENADDKRIIVLEHSMPWTNVLLGKPEPLFVIFKVAADKWYVRGVPLKVNSFEVRKTIPNTWGGKNGEELETESGVLGALFAHRGLFLVGASTKEAALSLAKKALDK